MIWIAPAEKDTVAATVGKRLWDSADQFRANSGPMQMSNCEMRIPNFQVRPVRQSKFDIRHSRRLWFQLFHSALNAKGRAGFVMANSASDARASEQEIRQKLIESRAVDVMVANGTNHLPNNQQCSHALIGQHNKLDASGAREENSDQK